MISPCNFPWPNVETISLPPLGEGAHVWELPLTIASEGAPGAEKPPLSIAGRRENAGSNSAEILRKILSFYPREQTKDLELRRGYWGKPYISGGPYFSLSHTRGRALVLVAPGAAGLDLERADRPVRARELAARFFFTEEQEALDRLGPEERRALFLRLWVAKEAIVKLAGEGVFEGIRDARVWWDGERMEGGCYRGRKVWLTEFSPAPDLVAAAAFWEKKEIKCFFRL